MIGTDAHENDEDPKRIVAMYGIFMRDVHANQVLDIASRQIRI